MGACSVTPESSQPYERQPTRLLCPWDSPGLQTRILEWVAMPSSRASSLTQGLNSMSPALQVDSLPTEPPGKPKLAVSSRNLRLQEQVTTLMPTCPGNSHQGSGSLEVRYFRNPNSDIYRYGQSVIGSWVEYRTLSSFDAFHSYKLNQICRNSHLKTPT